MNGSACDAAHELLAAFDRCGGRDGRCSMRSTSSTSTGKKR
jgi:hypothetical protein